MKNIKTDSVVIGGGAAGMGAALEIDKGGYGVIIVEREQSLGGILLQCIHNGFGIHKFNEELTGPEYAFRYINKVKEKKIETYCETTIFDIETKKNIHKLYCSSKKHGVFSIETKSVVLAMGCRERNRGNSNIAGDRPSGVYTAGLAQRLLNIDGYLVGKEVVIAGSGDIGLIMARRLTWSGAKVKGVVEILPHPSGLLRNVVQCLDDYDIPLYLGHIISKIGGKDRVKYVEITPLTDGRADYDKSFKIDCDTVLLSVGLIPENELSKRGGVDINGLTRGAFVNSKMMTSIDGIFSCGNVLHVHDLVDYVTEESEQTGIFVKQYLDNFNNKNGTIKDEVVIKGGKNIRYVIPNKIDKLTDNRIYFRSMLSADRGKLIIKEGENEIFKRGKRYIQPSEMISIVLKKEQLSSIKGDKLELSIDI